MAIVTTNTYDIGDRIRSNVEFRTIASVLTDPTTIVFKYKDPSENTTTLTFGVDAAVVKDAVGAYHVDWDIDESGTWHYRWEGTGALVGAVENWFLIRASEF
jgi:hypothetical protein